MRREFALLPSLLLATGASGIQPPVDPGPAPSWEAGVSLTEAAVRANLIDPQSAQFEWPYAFTGGYLKALFGKQRAGWFTCGWVNGKNRMGGYTGRVWFLVEIYRGSVVQLSLGQLDGIDAATATCPGLLKKGLLTAASSIPTGGAAAAPTAEQFAAAAGSSASAAAARGGIGIAFEPTPAGATLMAVAAGSPAEKAGLKPGETIGAINGLSLKGMSRSTMIEVLHAVPGSLVASIVGVGDVKVR